MAEGNQVDIGDQEALFSLRTTAKRKHTILLNAARDMMLRKSPSAALSAYTPFIEQAFQHLETVHERFVELAQLDPDGQRGAAEYLAEVRTWHDKCFAAIGLFLQRRTKGVGSRGDVTTSRDASLVSSGVERRNESSASNGSNENSSPTRNDVFRPANIVSVSHIESVQTPGDISEAKRRKIDLEFALRQSELRRERELNDLEVRSKREREDLLLAIEKESSSFVPRLSSTLLAPIQPDSSGVARTPPPRYKSSHRWPKLQVAKFDGDPRQWRQ